MSDLTCPSCDRRPLAITAQLADIPGIEDLRVEQQVEVPQIEVLLRPKQAARYAFSVGELNQDIQTLLKGKPVGQVYEQDRVFDVDCPWCSANPQCPTDLGRLRLDAPTGDFIPLAAVAEIGLVNSPNVINREGASRRILVTCDAEDRDVDSVMHDIDLKLQTVRDQTALGLSPGVRRAA